ncbi:MAG TPA: MFS transporter [Solirubrobacterales bacterium]|nr:MFS transporter [Solirubrobacterales bacterium]
MPETRALEPLRRPLFRRLATTYAVNEIGDWMGIIALSVLVFDRTGSAMATTVLFLGMRFLPAFFAPLLVTRAERPRPRFSLPIIYCGEATAFCGLALLASPDRFSLAAVTVLAAVDGCLALTGRSLTRAVVAALLEPHGELRAGNALLNVAFTGGAALGPALAGLAVAGLGVESALLLDAISFYAISWILFTAKALPQAEPEPGRLGDRVRAGIEYLREKVVLRRLLLAQGVLFVFFAAVIPIEVVYAKETLGSTDSGYGLMLASWGAGMVLGSFVFAGARRVPLLRLLLVSTLAVAGGYLGLAAAPSLAVACAASVLGGAGNGVQWVAAISAVQELTAAAMQARVMSVLESIGAAMPGIGFLLGGLVATVASPRGTFLVAGAGVLATVVVMAPLLGGIRLGRGENRGPAALDGHNSVVVELIPGEFPRNPDLEEGP